MLGFEQHLKHATVDVLEARTALRVGKRFAFRPPQQQPALPPCQQNVAHQVEKFRVGRRRDHDRIATEWIDQFDQAVSAIAHPHPAAQGKQVMDTWAHGAERQEGQAFFFQRDLGLGGRGHRHDAQFPENMRRRHPPEAFEQAVHHDGYAKALQEQGKQRRQVGLLAGAVISRQRNRPDAAMRHVEQIRPVIDRGQETEHFVQRFALDPQTKDDRTHFEIGNAAIEHCGVQLLCVVARQITRALGTAANLLDILCVAQSLLQSRSGCRHGFFGLLGEHALDVRHA